MKPDGSTVALGSQIDSSPYGGVYFRNTIIDTVTLPVNGTYTLIADPERTQIGSATFTLYDVPADPSPELDLATDGVAYTFSTTDPGQNATPTFDGIAGQDIVVKFTGNTFAGGSCSSGVGALLLKPDGTTLASRPYICSSADVLGPVALPEDGVYTLVVDPVRVNVGSITATVSLDEPQVTPAGALFEDVVYTDGTDTYPLNVTAHFPKGVSRTWVEKVGVGEIATSATCDPATTTCPEDLEMATTVDTATLAEGMHEFVARASGAGGRASEVESWRIFIDRTAPAAVSNLRVDGFESVDSTATIAWDEGADPDLPNNVDGSGPAGYEYRYQLSGQAWTSWQSADSPSFDVASVLAPSTLNTEVRELDGAGNVSSVSSAALTVTGSEASSTADVSQAALTGTYSPLDADVADPDTSTLSFTPSSPPVTFIDGSTTWRFTNGDGTWDIYKNCIDHAVTGGRFTVGPGYIAHMRTPGTNGRVLVRDDRIRKSSTEFIAGTDTPFGPMGSLNGGLGTFGFHYARSTNDPGEVPAGLDPTRPLTTPESEVISGASRDARQVPVIEGRQCAGKNGNPNYGVYAVTHPPALIGGQPNNPRTDAAGNVRFTVSVWFRDEWGNTGAGPNASGDPNSSGDAIARATYNYIFYPTVVKSWMSVTTFGSEDSAGGTRYIKEPKFSAVVRGGGFTRMKVFGGAKGGAALNHTQKFPSAVTDGPVQTPLAVLSPRQVGYSDRTRVQWDYGDNACANNNCFNVVMRSYPVVRTTGGLRPGASAAPLWQQTEATDPAKRKPGFGLDWWARRSGTKWAPRRLQAYARDTRGDVMWACIFRKGASTASDVQKAEWSQAVTPNVTDRRRWEIGGWKQTKTSAPFIASGAVFSGWNGGRGPYDCEQMQVKFADTTESFGTFASYSVGPGWSLR